MLQIISRTQASISSGTIPMILHVNVGAGYDVTIAEFAAHIKRCIGFEGQITYDRSRADGMPRKLLDSSRLQSLGWSPRTSLEQGLRLYYDWFLSHQDRLREIVIGAEVVPSHLSERGISDLSARLEP